MKRHRSFEFFVGDYFKSQGYEVEVGQGVNDWGADLFLYKDGVKYVVQAKMYGTSKTKVSRKQLFELHGVMAYFDCAKSILVYNGKIMPDALLVAEKLGIELVYLDYKDMEPKLEEDVFADDEHSFYTIWNQHIKALAGKTITNERGLTCQIGEVTDGYIERISEKGVKTRISVDLQRILPESPLCGAGFSFRRECFDVQVERESVCDDDDQSGRLVRAEMQA